MKSTDHCPLTEAIFEKRILADWVKGVLVIGGVVVAQDDLLQPLFREGRRRRDLLNLADVDENFLAGHVLGLDAEAWLRGHLNGTKHKL